MAKKNDGIIKKGRLRWIPIGAVTGNSLTD